MVVDVVNLRRNPTEPFDFTAVWIKNFVVVTEVTNMGVAANQGIKSGSVIWSINGKETADLDNDSLQRELQDAPTVILEVNKAGLPIRKETFRPDHGKFKFLLTVFGCPPAPVLVSSVDPNGAAVGKLKKKEMIVCINGRSTANYSQTDVDKVFTDAVANNSTVTLDVINVPPKRFQGFWTAIKGGDKVSTPYATNKTIAEGLMDFGQISLNAAIIKAAVTAGLSGNGFLIFVVVLCSLSIIGQVVLGSCLLALAMGTSKKQGEEDERMTKLNKFSVRLVSLILVLNILVSAFIVIETEN